MGNFVLKDRDKKRLLTESFVVTKDINVRDAYDIVEVIGKGSISTVYKIRPKQELKEVIPFDIIDAQTSRDVPANSNEDHVSSPDETSVRSNFYALKEINVAKVDPKTLAEFENEISALKSLDHRFVLKAYEAYNYSSSDGTRLVGLVLELCEGGDLYRRAPYTEQQAGTQLFKLVEALNYLHQHNFIHRDVKMENVMFESNDPDADIKLIDFGLSAKFLKNENFEEFVGTVYTMAPQVFIGHYTQAADMWSVGVVAFLLLSDEEPFKGDSKQSTANLIIQGKYSFGNQAWNSVSDAAKQFVSKLLQYEPSARYTAEQALKDKWLAQFRPVVSPPLVREVLSRLKQVSAMNEFEKLGWLVAARMANPTEIAHWRVVFDELDQNHDGQISYIEFKNAAIQLLGYKPREAAEVFRQVDAQSAGSLDYTTYLAALLAVQGRLHEDRLLEVFDHLDVDRCGYITREHIRQILGNDVSDEYIERVMKGVASADGKIGYEAFKSALNGKD